MIDWKKIACFTREFLWLEIQENTSNTFSPRLVLIICRNFNIWNSVFLEECIVEKEQNFFNLNCVIENRREEKNEKKWESNEGK